MQFERFCEMKINNSQFNAQKATSQEDSLASGMIEGSIKSRSGQYEKSFPPDLPNNKMLVEHRLRMMKRRLVKDPELHQKFSHSWRVCLKMAIMMLEGS